MRRNKMAVLNPIRSNWGLSDVYTRIAFSQQTGQHNWDGSRLTEKKQNIFLDLFHSLKHMCFGLLWIPQEAERHVPQLACFSTSSPPLCVATTINPRIDHQSRTVPVQSARCLISARQSQRINNSITEGFCIQEKGKEIQSKQINVPARMKNSGLCN